MYQVTVPVKPGESVKDALKPGANVFDELD
jgi:hypothetical protein